MFAKFFIERPVLANVIAIVIMLLGGVAVCTLPVAQYPPITPPTVQVTATYPGASAKTLVETVALPIEQQVNGVEKMLYMQSTCTSDGRYTLTVTFDVGTDLDFAQVLVQNRVAAAMSQLPQPVQQQGVVTKKKSTAILQIITLTSTNKAHDALFLSNFATLAAARPAGPPARGRRRDGLRHRRIQHAHLAGPGADAAAFADARGRHQRHPEAERQGRRRPDRHAARRPPARISN